jgi:hypothetical protein
MLPVLFSILISIIAFLCGIWVMIDGWGLTPHSWCIIIAGTLLNALLAGMIAMMRVAIDD